METLGDKIFELRKEKGVSQEQLAEVLDVTRHTVSRWERGEVIPSPKNLKAICNYFNVELAYFLNEEEIALIVTELAAYNDDNKIEQNGDLPKDNNVVEKMQIKFKLLKTILAVTGITLLVLTVISCGIGIYVSITPSGGQYIDVIHSVNYVGIALIITLTISTAILIALIVFFIIKFKKMKKISKLQHEE